jgi:hypothetical protein
MKQIDKDILFPLQMPIRFFFEFEAAAKSLTANIFESGPMPTP